VTHSHKNKTQKPTLPSADAPNARPGAAVVVVIAKSSR